MDTGQDRLSQREEEILLLASRGFTDKQIAHKLALKTSTVRTYWDRLKVKLEAANRTEAVARGLRLGTNQDRLTVHEFANAAPLLIAVTDSGHCVEFANSRWQDYFGPSADRLNWRELVHPVDLSVVTTAMQMADESRWRARYRRHDGAYRWHMGLQAPYKFEDGIVTKWIKTAIDIEGLSLGTGEQLA